VTADVGSEAPVDTTTGEEQTEFVRVDDPVLAEDIDPRELDAEVRAELRSLARPVATEVARRLVATGHLIDTDPELALAHALVARRKASRIAAVREAAGLAAYHAGQWQTAIAELRTYHRMSGKQTHLAVLADCERALGRPEKAIDLYRTADRSKLDAEEVVELLIVAAGARSDLGQTDAAVAMLQVRELTSAPEAPWAARLRYAYADALLTAERREEAREWFARAAEIDEDLVTDAAERLLELDGIVLEGDDADDDEPDETAEAGDESDVTADAEDDAEEDESEDDESDVTAEADDESEEDDDESDLTAEADDESEDDESEEAVEDQDDRAEETAEAEDPDDRKPDSDEAGSPPDSTEERPRG
jgi:tetratricopeptide (TPR) repeat protein